MAPVVENAIEQNRKYCIKQIWQNQSVKGCTQDFIVPKDGVYNSIEANGWNHSYPIVQHPYIRQ
jgi:hypothetical protein